VKAVSLRRADLGRSLGVSRKERGSIHSVDSDGEYDRDVLGLWLRRRGTVPVIPGRSNRLKSVRYSKKHYRRRNVIERMVCRLKGYRRQAARYDKSAQHFFSALCVVDAFRFLDYWSLDPNSTGACQYVVYTLQ